MQTASPLKSLLSEPEQHRLRPPEEASAFGSTIVFGPHPDDESLGCGGLLALLAEARVPAHVVVLTDGSRSHPNSLTHSAERLAALREQETLSAVKALGLPANVVQFLRFRDCGLPTAGSLAFAEAVENLEEIVRSHAPQTILIPWRRDPHCDHEATHYLLRAAMKNLEPRPRWLEYLVWAWPQPESNLAPRADEGRAWRLDITPVLDRKLCAIAQHRTQLGLVIHDDDRGFVLQPEMLVHFQRPWELFIEPSDV